MSGHHHGHDHGHGGHCHDEHSHDDDLTPAVQHSLHPHINFDAIRSLNEAAPGSGKAVIKKGWDQRLTETPVLESDADEQLLLTIPFTGQIKLHSILIHPTSLQTSARTIKLYVNREDLDFSTCSDLQPVQTLEVPLTPPSAAANEPIEIPVKRALFNNVRSLSLFVEDNQSQGEEEVTRITYLGFKGDHTKTIREPVLVDYEAAPNPADHKLEGQKAGMPGGLSFEGGGTGNAN
ncbi:DUF1000-domain-containing protein [Ascobolus immersus RN42]|uniref:DUF1000-domain-containing protein n=1 Tax=Ascobolus immersus RN42 TaxID=1160509 RepID=A0A3N4IPW0_ASCIM|nr:DUF1000-domain-containing protein [Ascobolus immersus RN42]